MGILSTDRLDYRLITDPADGVVGDLYVGPNGVEWVSGPDGVAQIIAFAIKLAAGEWVFNLDAGVQWDRILGEKFDESFIRSQLIAAVARTPGYVDTTAMAIDFDRKTRVMTVTWEIRVAFDDIGEQTVFGTTTVGGTRG